MNGSVATPVSKVHAVGTVYLVAGGTVYGGTFEALSIPRIYCSPFLPLGYISVLFRNFFQTAR